MTTRERETETQRQREKRQMEGEKERNDNFAALQNVYNCLVMVKRGDREELPVFW